jgi:cysteine desulfurase/selenocysteine lyase
MIDIDQVRADTPACENIIHFNNAGASLMPLPVQKAVIGHLEEEARIGGYEAEEQAAEDIASFYTELAALIGAGPDEIAYVENATRAWDMAFYGLPLEPGDRILTHRSEYMSNYLGLVQQAKRRGLYVDLVPSDAHGQIDVEALDAAIGPKTRLIALTHVPTHGGLVNPAEAVGKVARRHGLIYLLDACQSAGQIALDVTKIGCDILSGTGRKFLRGPRGTGFLYISRNMMERVEPPFIDLHAATLTGTGSYELAAGAKRFENWESYVAGRVGLARAVGYARQIGLDAIEARVTDLAAKLRAQLVDLPGVEVHDLGERKCAIATFTCPHEPAPATVKRLRKNGINVSSSDFPGAQLDFGPRGLTSVVRASVHYFNTEAEISRFCAAVAKR